MPRPPSASNTSRGWRVERQHDGAGSSTSASRVNRSTPGARRLVDGADRAPAVVHHDDRAVRALGQQRQRLGHRVAGAERERGVPDDVPRLDPRDDVGHRRRRDVLREHGERAAPGQGLGHPPPRDGRHVGRDHGHGRAGRIGAAEVDVEPRDHRRTAGDEEHVVVGEVVLRGLAVEEAHGTEDATPPADRTRTRRRTRALAPGAKCVHGVRGDQAAVYSGTSARTASMVSASAGVLSGR